MTKQSGQTLMELLLAMTVMAVGLFAAVTIVYSNQALVERDTDEVVSVNLAREGLELAQQLRDSNWLANAPFDSGMSNGTDVTAVPVWNGIAAAPSFDFTADDFTSPLTTIIRSSDANAIGFSMNSSTGAIGDSTPFKRLITFNPICYDDSTATYTFGSSCTGTARKVGVRVESHVQWNRKGTTKDVSLYEDLYDWR